MKTTVDIADPLFDEAMRVAAREGITVGALIEIGLSRVIADKKKAFVRFKLRRATFNGDGLQPDVECGSWDRIGPLAYEDRGG